MSTTTSVAIEGMLLPVTVSLNEYTSPAVANQFAADMAVLKEILNRTTSNPQYGGNPPPITPTDVANAVAAIQDLQLLTNGISQSVDWANPGTTTGAQVTYYLTGQMATNLDQVLKSLKAAGFTVTTPSIEGLQAWQSMAGAGIAALLQASVEMSKAANNRSIQSFIELEYVTTANDIIFSNLTTLQSALGLTSSVLAVLQIFQDMHNKITVTGPTNLGSTFSIYWNTVLAQAKASLGSIPFRDMTPQKYADIYKGAASKYFARAIPKTTFTSVAEGAAAANEILGAASRLNTLLAKVESANPGQGRSVPNTLAFQINRLITDMTEKFRDNGNTPVGYGSTDQAKIEAISKWVLDGRDASATATGIVQDHITQAITAGQSLNDTQKQNVRQYMFLFEEFYKSASAILSQISQILQKMAQGISR